MLNLFYPSAIEWMWNYCIYLGPFVSSDGTKYDLGIHLNKHGRCPSAAIVYGDTPGNYKSGELNEFGFSGGANQEAYEETRKRAAFLNLYKP